MRAGPAAAALPAVLLVLALPPAQAQVYRANELPPAAAAIHNQCARAASRELGRSLSPLLAVQGRAVIEAERTDRVPFGDLVRQLGVSADGRALTPAEHFSALHRSGENPAVQARYAAADAYTAELRQRYDWLVLAIDFVLPQVDFTREATLTWLQQLELVLREAEQDATRQRRALQGMGLNRAQGFADGIALPGILTRARIGYHECVYRQIAADPARLPAPAGRPAGCRLESLAGRLRRLTAVFDPSPLLAGPCLQALHADPPGFGLALRAQLHAAALTAPPPPPGRMLAFDRTVLDRQPLTLAQIADMSHRAYALDSACHRDALEPFFTAFAAFIDAGERQMLARVEAEANQRLIGRGLTPPFARERMSFTRLENSGAEHLERLRSLPAERRAPLGEGNLQRGAEAQRRFVEAALERIDVARAMAEREAGLADVRARYALLRTRLAEWRADSFRAVPVEQAGRIHGADEVTDPMAELLRPDLRFYTRALRDTYGQAIQLRSRQARACWERNVPVTGVGAVPGGNVCLYTRGSGSPLERLALGLLRDGTLRRCRAYPELLAAPPMPVLGLVSPDYAALHATIAEEALPNGWQTIHYGLGLVDESIGAINASIATINQTLTAIRALLNERDGGGVAGLEAGFGGAADEALESAPDGAAEAAVLSAPWPPDDYGSPAQCDRRAETQSWLLGVRHVGRPRAPAGADGATGAESSYGGTPCEIVACPDPAMGFEQCVAAQPAPGDGREVGHFDWEEFGQAMLFVGEVTQSEWERQKQLFLATSELVNDPAGQTRLEQEMNRLNAGVCYLSSVPVVSLSALPFVRSWKDLGRIAVNLGEFARDQAAGIGLESLGHPGLSESCDTGVPGFWENLGMLAQQPR